MAVWSRYNEVPDINSACDSNIDLIPSLDRNEKQFQKKMQLIFEKYNKPFEDDIVWTMEDLRNVDENGDCECRVVTSRNILEHSKVQRVNCNETYILSDLDDSELYGEDACGGQLVASKTAKPLVRLSDTKPGETYITDVDTILDLDESMSSKIFIQRQDCEHLSVNFSPVKCSPVNIRKVPRAADMNGSRKELSQRYLENNYQNNLFKSPSKKLLFTQIKQFIGRHNNSSILDSTVIIPSEKGDRKTDGEEADDEASNTSDLGNVSLAGCYPNMIECLSRLMDLPRKEMAAANIIRYYRRHVWFAKKHKQNIVKSRRAMCKARCSKMMVVSNLNGKEVSNTGSLKIKGLSPRMADNVNKSGLIECRKNTPTRCRDTTQTLDDSNSSLQKNTVLSKTFILDQTQNPVLTQTFILDADKTFSEGTRHAIHDYRKQKNELSFRLSHPSTSLRSSLENSPFKWSSDAWLVKCLARKEEVKSNVHSSPNKFRLAIQDQEAPNTLRRRHTFSTFPSQQRPIQSPANFSLTFENLYKKLSAEDLYNKSLSSAMRHRFSETVNALVYSPGSLRSKRRAGDDWSVPKTKRSHMAENFVNGKYSTYSPVRNISDLTQRQDSRLHQVPRSPLPMLMQRHDSAFCGSSTKQQYSRSPNAMNISRSSNSDNRINTSVYRKLNYTYDSDSSVTIKKNVQLHVFSGYTINSGRNCSSVSQRRSSGPSNRPWCPSATYCNRRSP
uniref:Uncharacterized protein n=1 Tax=Leptobrachium leishanense TaxID=445787 RepID=A0A8C5LMN7_9ANUR